MSNFMSAVKTTLDGAPAITENGAVGYRTTGRKLLDLNFAVASLRSASEQDIADRFITAFFEDKKENDLGVALVSGFSPNIAKMVMSGKLDPYECLLETLNTERYQPVEDVLRSLA